MRSLSLSALAGLSLISLSAAWSSAVQAQCVDLATAGTAISENFDSLAITGTSSSTPQGWFFAEAGTNANATYSTSTGSSTAGDTYSFGAAANTERAFGGLESGTLTPTVGGCFNNNTGATLTAAGIAYIGEQWRLGATGRTDRMDFQFSTDATSLTTGTWTDANSLDFSGPISAGTVGALDGNAPANRATVYAKLTGLGLSAGSTLWIRWNSFNAAGADDGLAVDDFNLLPITAGTSNIQFQPNVLTTTENGANVAYRVVLPYAPLAGETVTITASSDDVTEGTVSGPLVFTAANWATPQSIAITPGAAGDGNDGDVSYNITHAVASSGGLYSGQTAGSVSVTNANVDGVATIIVDPSSAIFVNEDGSMTQVVTIAAGPDFAPSADVSIALTNNSPTEVSLSTPVVVLTAGNSYSSSVTITGVFDAVTEPDMAFSVTTEPAVSGDISFDGTNPFDISGVVLDVPVVVDADLTITLTDTPDPVVAGTNLNYTATLTNGGPADAQDVNISLPLPAGTSFVSATSSAGGSCNSASPVLCTWAGATAPAGVRSVVVVAAVAAAATGTLSATAAAASPTTDPTPGNNTATATTTVNASADLSITLTDTPDPVVAGTNLNYTATLTNGGPADAQDVNISLPLPAGTSFVSATPSAGGSCNSASPVLCTWAGATAPAGVRSVTIVAAVAAATTGTLSATAAAASPTTDPTPGNNTATATTTVNASADLSITLTDTPDPVVAGTNLNYTATLTNGGPADAQDVNISLPLPAGTSFVSATPSAGGSCNSASPVLCTWAGATAPAGVRSVVVVVAVAAAATGTLSATAAAASPTTDPTPGNNTATETTTVSVSADLSITLADAPDPVVAGTNLTYTAIVSNAGPSDASGVSITLPVPANTSFVSGSVTGGGSCAGSPVLCTVTGNIAPAGSRTATITLLVAASAPDGSNIAATATVASTSPDPNAANNSASASTAVIANANLSLTLSASSLSVLTNEPVTFTAVSLNQGPSDAQNLSITVTLTPDFRYSAHTATGAPCSIPQVGITGAITCTWAGATAPNTSRTLQVVAYSNNRGATAVNAGTTSATSDPVTTNNLGNVSVQVGFPVEAISTMNSYGLMLLSLMLGLLGFAAIRRQD